MVCVNKIKLCHLVKNQGFEVTLSLSSCWTWPKWFEHNNYTLASPSRCLVASACPLLWFMDVVFLWYLNNLNANPIYKIIIENSAQLHHHLKLFIVSNPKILFKSYLLQQPMCPCLTFIRFNLSVDKVIGPFNRYKKGINNLWNSETWFQ